MRRQRPVIFALIGAGMAAIAYGLALLAGLDLGASLVTLMLAGALGGLIGGWIREKRGD